jgi:hypothetical protein
MGGEPDVMGSIAAVMVPEELPGPAAAALTSG